MFVQDEREWAELVFGRARLGDKRRTRRLVSMRRVGESHYRTRWKIEDYHKAWKTGCRVESRRQQDGVNLERIVVVTAFVAVRLLQLRSLRESEPDASCEAALGDVEWKCLWLSIEGTESPLPDKPPNMEWAYRAVGKSGGWKDSKRDGRVGWLLLWRGWSRLMERVVGFKVALQLTGRSEL